MGKIDQYAAVGLSPTVWGAEKRADIEGLREFRTTSPLMNWAKDLRTEVCRAIYDRDLYPENLYLDDEPMHHAEFAEQVTEKRIEHMVEEDIFVRPYHEREDE